MPIAQPNRWGYLITPLLFFIISIIWSQLTFSTWDDDAATRFFGTLSAGEQPQNFLDSWLRPLFVQVFYLPIKFFGRMGLVVTMGLVTSFSGILLYKGLNAKGVKNAYAALFFHLSQTYVFGISRDAMTEPLAMFILSLGCYLYFTERWGWFAIAGSFLPLARTETILLLPIWGWILLHRKQYKYIPLLGLGISILYLSWVIYAGNFHAFFDNLSQFGTPSSRYARTGFGQYTGKMVYIVGPVVFVFLLLGYFSTILKMFIDSFVLFQFTFGVVMYTVFGYAEKGLGLSAGFLRHMVIFAPLIAIISLYGFNFWLGLFEKAKKVVLPQIKNKKEKKLKTAPQPANGDTLLKKLSIGAFLFIVLVIAVNTLSFKLMYRQFYSEEEKDPVVIYFISAVVFFLFISLLIDFKRPPVVMIGLLFALQVAFTLFIERPNVNDNEERIALTKAADWVIKKGLTESSVYCNHLWFYWALMCEERLDLPQNRIDSVTLKNLVPGSLLVWEPHYTNKNYTNIPLERLNGDTSLVLVNYVQDKDKNTRAMLYVKQGETSRMAALFAGMAQKDTADPQLMLMKGIFEKSKMRDVESSNRSLNRAIQLDNNMAEAYFHRGENFLILNRPELACPDLQTAKNLGNRDAERLISRFCQAK